MNERDTTLLISRFALDLCRNNPDIISVAVLINRNDQFLDPDKPVWLHAQASGEITSQDLDALGGMLAVTSRVLRELHREYQQAAGLEVRDRLNRLETLRREHRQLEQKIDQLGRQAKDPYQDPGEPADGSQPDQKPPGPG